TVDVCGNRLGMEKTAALEYIVGTLVDGDVVNLCAGVYAPTPTLVLDHNVTINGAPGPYPGTTIVGGNTSGADPLDVSQVATGKTAATGRVTIELAPSNGSAVGVFGTLNLNSSTIQGNNATGVLVNSGATANISNSTLSANIGAGAASFGTLNLLNDTISG